MPAELEPEYGVQDDNFGATMADMLSDDADDGTSEPSEFELIQDPELAELEASARADYYLFINKRMDEIPETDIVGLHLKSTTQVPLLNKEEEVALSRRVEAGIQARKDLADMQASGDEESEEVRPDEAENEKRKELIAAIQDGWNARNHLLLANTRLVVSVAKKYLGRGLEFLDLIQEGNIGLIRGAKKFNYRRGNKFGTYATWWIRQAVTRAIAEQGRTIRVPVHASDEITKMLRIQTELTQRLHRDPTTAEIAEALGRSLKKTEALMQAAQEPISLESPTNDEEDSTLGDFIEDDDDNANTEERGTAQSDQVDLHELLEQYFTELNDERKVKILKLRYGFIDGIPYTLEEVGRKEGVTRERIRQLEEEAISWLRNPVRKRVLNEYRTSSVRRK